MSRAPLYVAGSAVAILAALSLGLMLFSHTNSHSAPPAPEPMQVSIDNFSFQPQSLGVTAGTTVTWINHDDVPHTIKDSANQFRSGTLDTDDSYSFTFTAPGEYPYYCGIHPHMVGTIVVK
jgi:plastocyanin